METEKKEKKFTQGFIFKRPRAGSPEWLKGNISIKVDEFINWLQQNKDGEWINIDLKESNLTKKLYTELNNWKPKVGGTPAEPVKYPEEVINAESIPF